MRIRIRDNEIDNIMHWPEWHRLYFLYGRKPKFSEGDEIIFVWSEFDIAKATVDEVEPPGRALKYNGQMKFRKKWKLYFKDLTFLGTSVSI